MKTKIVNILLQQDDYISGQEIANKLGISRQAVWVNIQKLKEKGYKIKSVENRGHRLYALPNALEESVIRANLKTRFFGKTLKFFDKLDSTNEYLKQLDKFQKINGMIAVAREQTNGRGRLGRSWYSRLDESITFSLMLLMKLPPDRVAQLTPLAGLVLCKALREFTGLDCKIKWPNDIIVGNKKLAGILTEMGCEYFALDYFIIGIGINVEQTKFPEEIAHKATSLHMETDKEFNKNDFFVFLVKQLEDEFMKHRFELTPEALEEYKKLCATLGRTVKFRRKNCMTSGKAVGINERGELLVRFIDGKITAVNSGEVTVQGIY